jgi:hypothetical protein
VTRAYEQRVQAVEADASLSEAARAAALAQLGTAYRVLSSPLRKADYDAQRLRERGGGDPDLTRRKMIWRALLLVSLPVVAAAGYRFYEARQAEMVLEEQRVDSAAHAQQLDEIRRRQEERQAAQERERQDAMALEAARLEQERRQTEAEQRSKRFEADGSYKSPEQQAQEKLDREMARQQQLAKEELERNRNALELARQKRFLQDAAPH